MFQKSLGRSGRQAVHYAVEADIPASGTFPTVIVAGFPKAGTTTFHRWLSDHPEVGSASVKEPNYFCDLEWFDSKPYANFNKHGVEGYSQYFAHLDDSATCIVESSVDYVFQSTALEQIPLLPSRPLLLFLVRNPSSQLYSLYSNFRKNAAALDYRLSFAEFVSLSREESEVLSTNPLLRHAIANCKYVDRLLPWVDAVGKDRMRVLAFEHMVSNREPFMREVACMLGIDPEFYATYEFPRENTTYRVRSPGVHGVARKVGMALPRNWAADVLRGFYRSLNTSKVSSVSAAGRRVLGDLQQEFRDYNEKLAVLFDVDVSLWNRA